MRALIWIVGILTALYSGYWFVGAQSAERAIRAQIEGLRAQGLTLDHSDLSLRGYPSRFDLTLTDPHLADPQSGLEWRAPFAQVFSLSYKPWHLIAALPPEQRLRLPPLDLTLRSEDFKASLVMDPGLSLPLNRMTLAVDGLDLTEAGSPLLAAKALRFSTRTEAMAENAHEFAFLATELRPDPQARALLARAGWPEVIERINLGGIARFDGPIRPADPAAFPALVELDVAQGDLVWGALRTSAKGLLRPDSAGLAEGRLMIEITGWQAIPAMLREAGVIKPDALFVVTAMLSGMAQQDGTPDTLSLPLTFAGGTMTLGVWPIGPAPRLR